MSKPSIFISCGQCTDAEKNLGKEIAKIVREFGFEPFFAEDVQDLNGLDTNILSALRDCVGFITILHPRGLITRPDDSTLTRASVWIEQEIAIVAYIQRVENRPIHTIAFKHKSVGREGVRDVIQLNPIDFNSESEILEALPERLRPLSTGLATGIQLQLKSTDTRNQDGHPIRQLEVMLLNESNRRIENYDFELRVPAGILKHWSQTYMLEVKVPSSNSCDRYFRLDQRNKGIVGPRSEMQLLSMEYCKTCAGMAQSLLAGGLSVRATIWIDGREYKVETTIEELEKNALLP